MRFRPTLMDLTAGVLVTVAVLIWSIWISRELRRPAPAAASAPVEPPRPAPPAARAEPRTENPRPLERETPPESAPSDVLSSVRADLKRNPADPAPLARLAGVRGDAVGDALVDFASTLYSKDVRIEALRMLAERGFSEGQLRRLAGLYDGEADDEIQVSILLGVQRSTLPAAEALNRKGVGDANAAVRGVAVSGLDPARDADRVILIRLAATDPSEQVRGSAAIQLQERIGDGDVVKALLAMVVGDASAENRMHAIAALRHESLKGDARVRAHLERAAAQDRSPDVRRQAQAAIDGLTRKNN
jgi:hypothetical protein